MIKKILGNMIILILIIMIYSSNIYASEVDIENTTLPNENTIDQNENADEINIENSEDTIQDENNEENESINTEINTPEENNNTSTNSEKENVINTEESSKDKNIEESSQVSTKPVQTNSTKEKSKEADLKELNIEVEGMTPEFSKDVTEYYLIIDLSIEDLNVTAKPVDDKATIKILGNKELKEGKNTITINVTAEDGTIKEYYIYVTKIDDLEKADAELKSLQINSYNIFPSFKPKIYNYNLNIQEAVTSLDIIAETQNENAKIKIEGNENLIEGNNLIKITVTAEDGITTKTYKIKAYISSKLVELQEEDKTPIIIVLTILAVCIVALGSFILIKKK